MFLMIGCIVFSSSVLSKHVSLADLQLCSSLLIFFCPISDGIVSFESSYICMVDTNGRPVVFVDEGNILSSSYGTMSIGGSFCSVGTASVGAMVVVNVSLTGATLVSSSVMRVDLIIGIIAL